MVRRMFAVAFLATIFLPGCSSPQGGGDPMASLVKAIFGLPDPGDCYIRGTPWVWDAVNRACIALTPEQLAAMKAREEASRPPPPEWEVAIQQQCRAEAGNYSLCLQNRETAHIRCDLLKIEAFGKMSTLQSLMLSLHATAEQVIESNMAGLGEWRPFTGPFPNQVSYADNRDIVRLAARYANTMSPRQFSEEVFRVCLNQ